MSYDHAPNPRHIIDCSKEAKPVLLSAQLSKRKRSNYLVAHVEPAGFHLHREKSIHHSAMITAAVTKLTQGTIITPP
jgi:hypothetical protein